MAAFEIRETSERFSPVRLPTNMRRFPYVLCGVFALVACHDDDHDDSGRDENSEGSVDPALQHQLDRLAATPGVYGVLAELRVGDKVTRARAGIADVVERGPVAWDSRFRTASATKPFVAVVVLQLVAEGKLSLDDNVERWLPGVITGNGNDGSNITIRQLLQHTSGLHDYARDYYDALAQAKSVDERRALLARRWTAAELIALGVAHPPDFSPGTKFAYCNAGYVVLGMIIDAVTGNRWDDEVTRRIIEPLGLRQTASPGTSSFIMGTHPLAYEAYGGELDITEASPTASDASGMLISTPHDINTFIRALAAGELLRPAELAEMKRTMPIDLAPGALYGLGWIWRPLACGGGYWGHPGDGLGFHVRDGVTDSGASIAIAITATGDADLETALAPVYEAALCPK
jgi:D-alanyl-D-alanine carboxypeptidase